MKFLAPVFFFLGIAAAQSQTQQVNLVFHAAPVSFNLSVTNDGSVVTVPGKLGIDHIDLLNYDPTLCTFKTASNKVAYVQTLTSGSKEAPYPFWTLAVGPPQPIVSVSCHGFCLAVYADCYNAQGQFVGPCCNGFCAANKCRPFLYPPPSL